MWLLHVCGSCDLCVYLLELLPVFLQLKRVFRWTLKHLVVSFYVVPWFLNRELVSLNMYCIKCSRNKDDLTEKRLNLRIITGKKPHCVWLISNSKCLWMGWAGVQEHSECLWWVLWHDYSKYLQFPPSVELPQLLHRLGQVDLVRVAISLLHNTHNMRRTEPNTVLELQKQEVMCAHLMISG